MGEWMGGGREYEDGWVLIESLEMSGWWDGIREDGWWDGVWGMVG